MSSEKIREKLSNKYHKRRLVKSGEKCSVIVNGIKDYFSDYILIELDVFEEIWYWKIPVDRVKTDFEMLIRNTETIDAIGFEFSSFIDKRISIIFNEEMNKAKLPNSNTEFDIIYEDNIIHDQISEISESKQKNIERKVSNEAELLNDEENAIHSILGVIEPISENKFKFPVYTKAKHPIEFEIELPITTSESSNSTARLIENLGGGDPMMIENEHVYLIQKNNKKEGFDKTKMIPNDNGWFLMTVDDFKDYIDYEPSKNSIENSDKSDDNETLSLQYLTVAFQLFMIGIGISLLSNLVPETQNQQEGYSNLLLIMQLIDIFSVIFVLLSIICLFGVLIINAFGSK